MIGLAIGDSLGAPFEGLSRFDIRRMGGVKDFTREPIVTDDTLLSILVAESIIECGFISGREISRKFVLNEDILRGLGPTTTYALKMIKLNPDYVSKTGTTNGAAMRAPPIGLACNDERMIEKTVEASLVTHGTDVALSGACSISFAIDAAIREDAKKDDVIDACIMGAKMGGEYGVKTRSLRIDERITLALSTSIENLPEVIGNGIQTDEAVPSAISIFYSSKNFVDAVINAVNLGGDTDTITSMTGAISGAFYADIPKEWMNRMKDWKRLEYLEGELLNIKTKDE